MTTNDPDTLPPPSYYRDRARDLRTSADEQLASLPPGGMEHIEALADVRQKREFASWFDFLAENAERRA